MISPMLYTKGAQQCGGQEIAPQTISTKDVYQSKHMVVLLLSAKQGDLAGEANIDTTYYYDQQWIIIINTHAKPLKSMARTSVSMSVWNIAELVTLTKCHKNYS